ncbi:MAG: hypothetical protein M1832_003655 [Thelocarpon impressellum]|nr:MAG: hypothetical protein M1832_003655 [Thelocarpon impressellum]
MTTIQEIVEATRSRRYPIDVLIELNKQLPKLLCALKKFSADAWRVQLLKAPDGKRDKDKIWFPADYPAVGVRKVMDIPSHEIPSDPLSGEDDVLYRGNAVKKKVQKLQDVNPTRQPQEPPKGVLTQQDAGFARFLKEVASPPHKRVTAGGRVVPNEPSSAHFKRSSNQRVGQTMPLQHQPAFSPMPGAANTTYYVISPDSYTLGPNGEIWFHNPNPQQQQQQLNTAAVSGAFQQPGQQLQQIPLITVPSNQLPNIQTAMQRANESGWGMPGNPNFVPNFPLENTTNAASNIRTPRVIFPIGSQFEFEQNQQALRNRLAQLRYEMSNLDYMSREDAERKILETRLVGEQMENFKQVWELQCQLAESANAPIGRDELLQMWEASLANPDSEFISHAAECMGQEDGPNGKEYENGEAPADDGSRPGKGGRHVSFSMDSSAAASADVSSQPGISSGSTREGGSQREAIEREMKLKKLCVSTGMPVAEAEVTKIPRERYAFEGQIRDMTNVVKTFFCNASGAQLDSVAADHFDPTHPLCYMNDDKKNFAMETYNDMRPGEDKSQARGRAKRVGGEKKSVGVEIEKNADGTIEPPRENRKYGAKGHTAKQTSAQLSLAAIYYNDAKAKKQTDKMDETTIRKGSESQKRVVGHGLDEENMTEAEVMKVVKNREAQKSFLDAMLKDPRYADGTVPPPEFFDHLIKEQVKKHRVRADYVPASQRKGENDNLESQGPAARQPSLKGVISPPVSYSMTAQATHQTDERAKGKGKEHGGAMGLARRSSHNLPAGPLRQASRPMPPALVALPPSQKSAGVGLAPKPSHNAPPVLTRLSSHGTTQQSEHTQPQQGSGGGSSGARVGSRAKHDAEVHAFFERIKVEEELAIAAYEAQNPL